jgi:hypothetical protein
MFNKPASALFNRSLSLVTAVVATKFERIIVLIWSHFVIVLKSDLDVQKSRVQFVKQKVMLRSSFRFD